MMKVQTRAMFAKETMVIVGSSPRYALSATSKTWLRDFVWLGMRSSAFTVLYFIVVGAHRPEYLRTCLTSTDGEWIQTIIDDKLYLIASDWWESTDLEKATFAAVNRHDAEEKYRKANQTGSKALYFAQCSSENETWLPLLEKAFAKAHGDFRAIEGGFTG